ncbi:STAS domain-containing protein [Algicola sagamiensis]|uniref:STAS domain-containing protein n=1 Tax=Algicola sagamiensis TaxID=163869 RepID=UPI00035D5BE6|nr:STAS domain-containing protein [Algicola sagamiensis]
MLELPEKLIIQEIEDIYQSLLEAQESTDELCLDGHAVTKADTAAIQLLCSLKQHLESQNKTLKWQAPSEMLIESATLLGMSDYLELTVQEE